MPKLISRAEFARRCGVSKQAISKACDKQLAAACVADRIDVDHETARAYMAAKGVTLGDVVSSAGAPPPRPKRARAGAAAPTGSKKTGRSGAASPPAPRRSLTAPDGAEPPDEASDEDLADLAAYLHPLIERWGVDERFKFWLEQLKDIEAIREKRLKNAATEGKLISRELVAAHVFGAIESANKRLLRDAPKTIASRAFELARSSTGNLEQAERMVRDEIASHLRPVKGTAARNLRRTNERLPDDDDGKA